MWAESTKLDYALDFTVQTFELTWWASRRGWTPVNNTGILPGTFSMFSIVIAWTIDLCQTSFCSLACSWVLLSPETGYWLPFFPLFFVFSCRQLFTTPPPALGRWCRSLWAVLWKWEVSYQFSFFNRHMCIAIFSFTKENEKVPFFFFFL